MMFPEKPGVMKSREFVADDVVFTFNRLNRARRGSLAYFDFVSWSRRRTNTPSSST